MTFVGCTHWKHLIEMLQMSTFKMFSWTNKNYFTIFKVDKSSCLSHVNSTNLYVVLYRIQCSKCTVHEAFSKLFKFFENSVDPDSRLLKLY